MITITFDPEKGIAIPDAQITRKVNRMIQVGRYESIKYVIGNELVLQEVLLRILRGELSPSQIKFMANGKEIIYDDFCFWVGHSHLNKRGKLSEEMMRLRLKKIDA